MSDNLYELSDALFQFRRWFLQEKKAGAALTPEQVEQIGELLFVFGQAALQHAHEISRHRWNEAVRKERPISGVVDDAMQRDSNVVLLRDFLRQPEVPA